MSKSAEEVAPIFRTKTPNLLNVNDLKYTKSSSGSNGKQLTYFINVEDKGRDCPVLIQTDSIKLVSYGIPRPKNGAINTNSSAHNIDSDKDQLIDYIKLPLDDSQPACVDLKKHLEEVDQFFGSDKFKTRTDVFGKNAKNYTYSPLI
ncbi:hypothetical protein EON71_01130, partial [bacterium]